MPILLLPSQYSPLTTPQRGASLKEAEEKAAAGGEGEEWNVVVETSMGEVSRLPSLPLLSRLAASG